MRILEIAHNHPDLHPGGTEIFALGLHRAINASGRATSFFLGAVDDLHRTRLPGTAFRAAGPAPDEMLLWAGHHDRFFLTQNDPEGTFQEFAELLRLLRPDVVHFHHLLLFGADALAVVRRVLPSAVIVLTLHDYFTICANEGTMVTTADPPVLCPAAAPQTCQRCFPQVPARAFRMRELGLRANLRFVDHFLSPSAFLRDRFVAWGLPPERISVLRNAQAIPAPLAEPPAPQRRNRFGVFGNITPYKGALVALDAAQRLATAGVTDFSLTFFGSDALQGAEFRKRLDTAREQAPPQVRFHGAYVADERPALYEAVDWVVVPSTWWENAPLVIDEAFHYRRPVICSDIGGMAERVPDGTGGLQFAAGNAQALADRMARAIHDPALWDSLSASLPRSSTMDDCRDAHLALFERLRPARPAIPNQPARAPARRGLKRTGQKSTI